MLNKEEVLQAKSIDVRKASDSQLKRSAKARVYFTVQDETVMENLQRRRSRPIKLFRALLPEVYKALGKDSKARWSQYAGCSCPCSPGFILDDVYGKTIYVTV